MVGNRSRQGKWLTLSFGLVLMSLTIACGTSEGETAMADGRETSIMEGTFWRLTTLNGTAIDPNMVITLVFENGRVGGQAVCNNFGTMEGDTYVADAAGNLSIPSFLQSARGCSPESAMKLENDYITALRQSAHYRITGDRLELADAFGVWHLVFERSGGS